MPFGSAPAGNKNASKAKRWQKALERALARSSTDGDVESGLASIADTVVESARAGDKDAWREIGDRLDGKALQTLAITQPLDDIPDDYLDAAVVAVRAILAAQHSGAGESGAGQAQHTPALQALPETT